MQELIRDVKPVRNYCELGSYFGRYRTIYVWSDTRCAKTIVLLSNFLRTS